MEEKKNNKGLIILLILFLVLCLIAIFYFMFKMVYKEPTNNNSNETSNTETNSNKEKNSVVFTELTKYTLEEGEEKEVTVDNKKIKFKVENNTYYFNNKEIGKLIVNQNKSDIYITNSLIIFSYIIGQSGNKYYIYDFNGNKISIEDKGGEEAQYYNMRLKNNRLFIDVGGFGDCYDEKSTCYFFQRLDTTCENVKNRDIKENIEEYEKHKNDAIFTTTYEIKYDNNNIIIEKAEDINTIEQWIETYDKVCLIEINN